MHAARLLFRFQGLGPSQLLFLNMGCPRTNETRRMLQVGYDLLVDYWSIGCILFEMLAGMPE
jgi:serine/threonine protein kinase